jgi:selenocysteine lyase/cysteine desulfurase
MDVKRLDPDFVLFPTYKWLLGPYGRAFLYIAKRHQGGIPLEQTSFGRRDVRAENEVYFADVSYVSDAGRFDMGERDHFISMEMASIGMEMMAEWGATAIAQRLLMLTERIAEGAQDRRRRAGATPAGAAYPEPQLQGRDADRPHRRTRNRRHLRRGASGSDAHFTPRL